MTRWFGSTSYLKRQNKGLKVLQNEKCNQLALDRSVAQLVEHRSPKPGVAGSIPATPAEGIKDRKDKIQGRDIIYD